MTKSKYLDALIIKLQLDGDLTTWIPIVIGSLIVMKSIKKEEKGGNNLLYIGKVVFHNEGVLHQKPSDTFSTIHAVGHQMTMDYKFSKSDNQMKI